MLKETELLAYTHIVFGVEHYNHLGIVRSLGERGIKSYVIMLENPKKLVGYSKYAIKSYVVKSLDEGYRLLMKFARNDRKSFIYTGDDFTESFLDRHYDELKDYFYFTNGNYSGRINYYMNKDNIKVLAKECGLPVLKSVVVKKGEIPDGLMYPIITKSIASIKGGWKRDVHVCHNEDELMIAYKSIEGDQLLLEEYIEKKNELCIDGISINKGNDIFISIGSNYIYLLPSEFSSYMNCFNYNDKDVVSRVNDMMRKIEFEGIFCTEFLIDKEDNLYFLETNFRNSGWSWASTKAGMNLPVLWAKSILNGKIEDAFNKVPDGFTAMVEPADYRARVKTGKITMLKWMKDLLKSNCLFYWEITDIKPFIMMFLQ